MPSKTSNPESLNVMIVAAIVAWAGTFAFVHGPFVFGYIALHAATTGVFLLAIHRSDKAREQRLASQPALATASTSVNRSTTKRVNRPQPAA